MPRLEPGLDAVLPAVELDAEKTCRRHLRHHPEDPEQAEVTLAWYPEGKPG